MALGHKSVLHAQQQPAHVELGEERAGVSYWRRQRPVFGTAVIGSSAAVRGNVAPPVRPRSNSPIFQSRVVSRSRSRCEGGEGAGVRPQCRGVGAGATCSGAKGLFTSKGSQMAVASTGDLLRECEIMALLAA